MILSAQSIRARTGLITPFHERTVEKGMTFGLSGAGYDIRTQSETMLFPGSFALVCSMEHFAMPNDLVGRVHDKSTLARKGLCVQNTIIEPGWRGYLTLELTIHSHQVIPIWPGMPIAQIVFETLDEPTEQPYSGKYQDQPPVPVGPRNE